MPNPEFAGVVALRWDSEISAVPPWMCSRALAPLPATTIRPRISWSELWREWIPVQVSEQLRTEMSASSRSGADQKPMETPSMKAEPLIVTERWRTVGVAPLTMDSPIATLFDALVE